MTFEREAYCGIRIRRVLDKPPHRPCAASKGIFFLFIVHVRILPLHSFVCLMSAEFNSVYNSSLVRSQRAAIFSRTNTERLDPFSSMIVVCNPQLEVEFEGFVERLMVTHGRPVVDV